MSVAPSNLAQRLFEDARARGHGDRVALRQGDRAWTYDQLAEQVERVAGALRSVKIARGERVALLMRDTLEAVASLLGTIHAGAVAVPLSELATPIDLKDYLVHAGCAVAIVEGALDPVLDEIRAEIPALREVLCVGPGSAGARDFHALLAAATPPTPAAAVTPEEVCVLLYSAGAGPDERRAVPHNARTIAAAAASCGRAVLGLTADDRVLSTARLSTAYGLGAGLLFPLAAGAEVVLLPEQPRSEALFAAIERHAPTLMCATPTVYGQLARDAQPGQAPLSGLRLAVAGAEGLPEHLVERVRQGLGTELTIGYGLTEMLQFALSASSADPAWQGRAGMCGRPLPDVEARVVDDAGEPAAADSIGTLQLRAPSMFTGYWGDGAAAVGPDGWFSTRDRFLVDGSGLFHHCGRVDDLFKVGGKWVSPAEIERAHRPRGGVGVRVIGADDEDGFVKPLAFVVANVGQTAGVELEADLRAYVKQTLALHKYPRWIEFVDALPRGPGGKVLRQAAAHAPSSSGRDRPLVSDALAGAVEVAAAFGGARASRALARIGGALGEAARAHAAGWTNGPRKRAPTRWRSTPRRCGHLARRAGPGRIRRRWPPPSTIRAPPRRGATTCGCRRRRGYGGSGASPAAGRRCPTSTTIGRWRDPKRSRASRTPSRRWPRGRGRRSRCTSLTRRDRPRWRRWRRGSPRARRPSTRWPRQACASPSAALARRRPRSRWRRGTRPPRCIGSAPVRSPITWTPTTSPACACGARPRRPRRGARRAPASRGRASSA
ncbi:MAG: AMP-binding protein [Kofleriaceae bacterium]